MRKRALRRNHGWLIAALIASTGAGLAAPAANATHIRHGAELVHSQGGGSLWTGSRTNRSHQRQSHHLWNNSHWQHGWSKPACGFGCSCCGIGSGHAGNHWHGHWQGHGNSGWNWHGWGSSQLWTGGGETRRGTPMVAAGSVVDPVNAYQQWQAGVAMQADASQRANVPEGVPRVDRAAAARANPQPATATHPTDPIAMPARLETWHLLSAETIDWPSIRDRFAALTTDATLSGEQRHEARLGFVLAATITGEHRAAAMAARRIDPDSTGIMLEPGLAAHLEAARRAIASANPADRDVFTGVLNKLATPTPGGAALHAAKTSPEGPQS